MPQAALVAALPAAIGAAGSIGGAIVGSRSQNKATKASQDANRAALQYQRERDTLARQDFNKAMRAYEANRNALLQRYGISVPTVQEQPPMGPNPELMARGPQQGQPIRGIPGNLGALIRGGGYTGPRQMY